VVLSFTTAGGPRQRSHSRVRFPRDSWPYFTVSDLRPPKPGWSGPRIFIPQEQSGLVIPPGTGFPLVASYDSQGYGGGIRTVRTRLLFTCLEQSSRSEAYCRQPAGTLSPGTGPRWDPWSYICSVSRPLLCFVFPFVDLFVGLLYIYRMVFTYYTLRHLRLLFPPLRVLE
jgi:hypothetical protein